MPRIIPIHWKKFEKFLFKVNCKFERERGDHLVYSRNGLKRPIVIVKDRAIPVFIIRNNLRVLRISHERYLEILEDL